MNLKATHYKFNNDPAIYEICWVDVWDRHNSYANLAVDMAKQIHCQSCGDQPFPIMIQFYDEDNKFICTCEVQLDMEPSFFATRLKDSK